MGQHAAFEQVWALLEVRRGRQHSALQQVWALLERTGRQHAALEQVGRCWREGRADSTLHLRKFGRC